MKKKTRENKIKMLCDIAKLVAEFGHLDEIKPRAAEICIQYFPNADEVFINEVSTMARYCQNVYAHYDSVIKAINEYKA